MAWAAPVPAKPLPETGMTYYASTVSLPRRAALGGRLDVDTCVVGGGLAGLNVVLGLLERGHRDVALLEAKGVGEGASGRNGGFVFGGYSLGEQALIDAVGLAAAQRLYAGTRSAVALVRERTARYRIDCEREDAGVLWVNWFRDPAGVLRRQALLREAFGVDWEWISRDALAERLLTPRYHGALLEREAFHFNPLRYVAGLADACARLGAKVHEGSPATALHADQGGWRVSTPEGEVRARRVVLACGGYLAGLRRAVDAAVMPIATYVMATEPLGTRMAEAIRTRAAVYDSRFAFDYYRPLRDGRLLWGGRISVRDRRPDEVAHLLRKDMLRVYPQLADVRVEHAWSGLMSYARHEMPQIAEVEPGLWVAQAFGGHGVAPTTHAGEVIASAIVDGSPGWRDFQAFGMGSAFKPAGLIGAQLTYWWLQARDAWAAWRERS